jgi:hypothetical protein
MFNKARAWGYFTGDNPARGVEKFRETPRERWLRPDEAPAFFNALVSEPNSTMRDIFTTLLLTGAMSRAQLKFKKRKAAPRPSGRMGVQSTLK